MYGMGDYAYRDIQVHAYTCVFIDTLCQIWDKNKVTETIMILDYEVVGLVTS